MREDSHYETYGLVMYFQKKKKEMIPKIEGSSHYSQSTQGPAVEHLTGRWTIHFNKGGITLLILQKRLKFKRGLKYYCLLPPALSKLPSKIPTSRDTHEVIFLSKFPANFRLLVVC